MRSVVVVTEQVSNQVRKWTYVLIKNLDSSLMEEILLGGSQARQNEGSQADTDMFVKVVDGATFIAAEQFRAHVSQTSANYLTSTISYRHDFGMRVRVATTPLVSCSFFFFDSSMIRNVAHWRRGVRLWEKEKRGVAKQSATAASLDHMARYEEWLDGLLEIPAALKYLSRHDHLAVSRRLDRIILHLVNVATLNSADYLSGSDKGLGSRIATLKRIFPKQAASCHDMEPFQDTLLMQISFCVNLLQTVPSSLISPDGISQPYERYLADAVERLLFWEASLTERSLDSVIHARV